MDICLHCGSITLLLLCFMCFCQCLWLDLILLVAHSQQPFIRPGFTWLPAGNIFLSDKIMKIGEISRGTESKAARVATCLSSPDAAC